MRQLYLENAAGERIDLNAPGSIIASKLKGFGLMRAPTSSDLSHGFFVVTDDTHHPQESVGFDLNFVGANPYEQYRELVHWLAAASELRLVYKPYGTEEYCRRVRLTGLEKSELNQVGWLTTPAEFEAYTPWYSSEYLDLSFSGAAPTSMRYDFAYTAELTYGSDAAGSFSAQAVNRGHSPADLRLEIRGQMADPEVRLTDAATGEQYGRLKVYADFAADDTLILDSDYADTRIYRLRADGSTEDLMNALDLSVEPVLRIPQGRTCNLQIVSLGEMNITPSASAKSYYWSV